MGVRGGCRRNFLRITAWHYQAVDMEICPALLSWNIWACLRGLRTTKVQNSLRIRPVWSGPLLFTFWKESYLDFLQAKFQFSICLYSWAGWFEFHCRKPRRQVFLWRGPYNSGKIYTADHVSRQNCGFILHYCIKIHAANYLTDVCQQMYVNQHKPEQL